MRKIMNKFRWFNIKHKKLYTKTLQELIKGKKKDEKRKETIYDGNGNEG